MNYRRYSHCGGEIAVPAALAGHVEKALTSVVQPIKRGSAAKVRTELLAFLRNEGGWSDSVRISAKRGLTLTAKHGKTGLCLQTGNMARFYADLLKLQAQFLDGKITSAVYVLASSESARVMGDNLANYERLTGELQTMFYKVITVPLLVYGFRDGA